MNPSFEKEPHFEVLPLVPRKTKRGKSDPNFKDGRNPRQIHFYINKEREPICVECQISEIEFVERKNHLALGFSNELEIEETSLEDLIMWRASRYLRTAFPDSFEEGFRSVKDRFSKLIVAHDDLVDSILIHLDSLEEQNQYEVDLRLMVAPTTLAVTNNAETLKQLAEGLQKSLKASPVFFEKDCIEPKCSVMSMAEMTLWDRKSFLDFSRFDYLSFGEGNQVN
ncbi:MAG: hypothetical protein L3J39_06745 [Verrucomicrobiales bacterium]|nr:hypothetical protein [Verrucomicrobiales bacterium]